jgi:hypothetical protein
MDESIIPGFPVIGRNECSIPRAPEGSLRFRGTMKPPFPEAQ